MRHGKKINHLSRPAAHRKALMANLAKSIILHKRIHTTIAKAKALRKFIEPILTKAKDDSTHSRRVVFSYFQDKVPVKELFNNIAAKIADRPGGYTRIIKLGNRLGDNAEMCMMELVDYNDLLQKESKPDKTKTRRGRGKDKVAETTAVSQVHAEGKEVTEGVQASENVTKHAATVAMDSQEAITSEVDQELTNSTVENVLHEDDASTADPNSTEKDT
jgi:large subunit ribosomal protein L17